MRCKRHTVDITSSIGVCSSCLRERLLSLAASAAVEDNNRRSRKSNNNHPPVLILPRSVSPYVTQRKSDAGEDPVTTVNPRFFTTQPPVDLGESNQSLKSKESKNFRFSNLFRTRSEDLDYRFSGDVSESSSSRSWISTILPGGRRKKQPATACYIEDVIAGGKIFCRGMSPARESEQDPSLESIDESPGSLRRTPARKTPGRRTKIPTGMSFCLSPLVRAKPNCPFKRKARFPSEFGNSGEITASDKPHISTAASFCANRSKKLVDLGRVNRRR